MFTLVRLQYLLFTLRLIKMWQFHDVFIPKKRLKESPCYIIKNRFAQVFVGGGNSFLFKRNLKVLKHLQSGAAHPSCYRLLSSQTQPLVEFKNCLKVSQWQKSLVIQQILQLGSLELFFGKFLRKIKFCISRSDVFLFGLGCLIFVVICKQISTIPNLQCCSRRYKRCIIFN